MRYCFLTCFFIANLGATTINFWPGDIYRGEEFVNERPTGKFCYVQSLAQEALPLKGQHCQQISVNFIFKSSQNLPVENIALTSSISNYHLPEYPERKSCAHVTADGEDQPGAVDIYGRDDTFLYLQLLTREQKIGTSTYHYFLIFEGENKAPIRAKINVIKILSEENYVCERLESYNPL